MRSKRRGVCRSRGVPKGCASPTASASQYSLTASTVPWSGVTGPPAFLTSELKEAFIIGFFLFVPFLVIDLVVGNILLALGMHMLSPTTISLPFKFLLFVLVDGWHLLTRGLIAGYL